jgi:hypothetical protein
VFLEHTSLTTNCALEEKVKNRDRSTNDVFPSLFILFRIF